MSVSYWYCGTSSISCLPFIGSAAAVINGGISLARGNYGEAALNFACAIPGAAWAKVGAKAVKLGKVAVTAVKAEKAVSKALKIAKFTGEILGKGKTLALKAIKKIPKLRVQEVYVAGLRTAEGIEVGGFKYYRLAIEAGEKGTGKIAKGVFTEKEIHSYDNLRGIPKEVNSDLHLSKIRKEWNKFYRENPSPSKEDLLKKRKEIDDKYGHLFNPPK